MKPWLFPRCGLLLSAAMLSLAPTIPALSAQQQSTDTDRQTQRRQQADSALTLPGAHKLSQLSELMDQPVRNRQGEEVGNLREFVIDRDGQLRYAVLGHGGMLGVGEQWTAIDWKLLEIAPEGDHFIVDVAPEQVAEAPTFDTNNWPAEPQVRERRDWPAPTRRAEGTDSQTVTLREGETLSTLAERLYGKPEMWEQIYEANREKIDDPDHVPAGTQLTLPKEPRR